MIYFAPPISLGGPARVLVLQEWYKVEIQIVGAGTVYLGTSKDEAGRTQFANTQDGLQFNAANCTRPYSIWWKGEMWASGSDPGVYFVVVIPGITAERSPINKCVQDEEMTAAFNE